MKTDFNPNVVTMQLVNNIMQKYKFPIKLLLYTIKCNSFIYKNGYGNCIHLHMGQISLIEKALSSIDLTDCVFKVLGKFYRIL